MQVITLLSDWNQHDYYIAAIKGKIINQCPGVNIIDISHQIPSYNIAQGAFILKNSYANFPKKTIHLVAIKTEYSKEKSTLLIKTNGHYFVGCDNGLFSLVFEEKIEHIFKANVKQENSSFPAFDMYADLACKLVKGTPMEELGSHYKDYRKNIPMHPAREDNIITGNIIYIDSYRNVISNITEELFKQVGKGRRFEIFVQSNHYVIKKINTSYNQTSQGELLALFNATGYLEIAINNGNVAELLNLNTNSTIRVKFYDE